MRAIKSGTAIAALAMVRVFPERILKQFMSRILIGCLVLRYTLGNWRVFRATGR
jgi:hypothetical protein